MAMEERGQTHSIYEVEVEREDQVEEEDEEDSAWSQFDDLAAAVLEDPENEQLLTAFQDMKKKLQYRDARKMLAKSRIARDYYPVENPKYTKPFKRDGGKMSQKFFMVTACDVASMVIVLVTVPKRSQREVEK